MNLVRDIKLFQKIHHSQKSNLQTFKTTANMARSGSPIKFTPRADSKMLKEASKNPKKSSRDLQQALGTVDVKVHASTTRKRLHNFNYHGRCARGNLCSLRKAFGQDWSLAKNTYKGQDFWNNVLWTDESKIELFGNRNRGHVWYKQNKEFQQKYLIPTVKRGGGSVMVWGWFAAAGPGQLKIIESTVNSTLDQKVLEEHVRSSVKKLKLKQNWTLQHDNDPKHTSKVTYPPRTVWKVKKML